jgi:hypothetical protein
VNTYVSAPTKHNQTPQQSAPPLSESKALLDDIHPKAIQLKATQAMMNVGSHNQNMLALQAKMSGSTHVQKLQTQQVSIKQASQRNVSLPIQRLKDNELLQETSNSIASTQLEQKSNNTGLESQLLETNSTAETIQREVYTHHKKPTAKVNIEKIKNAKKIAKNISDTVDRVRPLAVDWRQFSNESGYLKNWYKNANQQYQLGGNGDVNFLHASFGYAVETLACEQLSNVEFGLNIGLQVASGHTRPDVEIKDDADNIVSWMDITTDAEKNHTNKKTGSGWKTHPYVCEILYPSLVSDEVFTASDHPFFSQEGQLLTSKAKNRREATEGVMLDMYGAIDSFKEENPEFTGPGGNQNNKKSVVKDFALQEFGEEFGGKKINQTMASTFNYLGFNSGHFGFKKEKQSNYGFNTYVRNTAQPDLDQRNTNLFEGQHTQVEKSLHRFQHSPQMTGFHSEWEQAEALQKEDQLRREYMRKACIEVSEKLKAAHLKLRLMPDAPGQKIIMEKMIVHLFRAPFNGDIQQGLLWIKEAQALLEWFDETEKHFTPQTINFNHAWGNSPGNNPGSGDMDI